MLEQLFDVLSCRNLCWQLVGFVEVQFVLESLVHVDIIQFEHIVTLVRVDGIGRNDIHVFRFEPDICFW